MGELNLRQPVDLLVAFTHAQMSTQIISAIDDDCEIVFCFDHVHYPSKVFSKNTVVKCEERINCFYCISTYNTDI